MPYVTNAPDRGGFCRRPNAQISLKIANVAKAEEQILTGVAVATHFPVE